MSHALVTGGTGFIGRHLVERLLQRGDRVRCLVRRLPQPTIAAVEYVLGDILVPASLGPALANVEVVYHLAGATLVCSTDEYFAGNGQGNAHVAAACADVSAPPVVVYVSSLAAVGPALNGQPLTEAAPPAPVSAYGQSKLEGERHFRAVAGRVPITIIRPPSVFGPGDPHTLVLFRTVHRGFHFVPGWNDIHMSWIYVEDLVEALILAAEHGRRLPADDGEPGEGIYFAALEEWPNLAEVGRLAADALGRKLWHTFHVPGPLCRFFGHCNDVISRISRRPLLLSSDKMREGLAGPWLCTAEKARRELGFACSVGLAEGFRRTVKWYEAQGWL